MTAWKSTERSPGGNASLPAQRAEVRRKNNVRGCRQKWIQMMRTICPVPNPRIASATDEKMLTPL